MSRPTEHPIETGAVRPLIRSAGLFGMAYFPVSGNRQS